MSAASEKKASKAAEKSSSTPLSLAKLVKKNSKVVPLPEASKKKSPHANGSKAASGVVKKVAKKDANTVQLDNMLEDELDGGMDQEEEEEEVDNTEEEGDASAVM